MAPISDVHGWSHARWIIGVQSETQAEVARGKILHNRYYVSNYGAAGLSYAQWLALVRRHWAVENNNHWVFDTAFLEDKQPWIHDPHGMLNTLLLRRIAYNMMSLYRAVTLRAEQNRATPWPTLLRAMKRALIRATEKVVAGLKGWRRDPSPA